MIYVCGVLAAAAASAVLCVHLSLVCQYEEYTHERYFLLSFSSLVVVVCVVVAAASPSHDVGS